MASSETVTSPKITTSSNIIFITRRYNGHGYKYGHKFGNAAPSYRIALNRLLRNFMEMHPDKNCDCDCEYERSKLNNISEDDGRCKALCVVIKEYDMEEEKFGFRKRIFTSTELMSELEKHPSEIKSTAKD